METNITAEDDSSAHQKLHLIREIKAAGGKLLVEIGSPITGKIKGGDEYKYTHWEDANITYSYEDNHFYATQLSGSLAKYVFEINANGTFRRGTSFGFRYWRRKQNGTCIQQRLASSASYARQTT